MTGRERIRSTVLSRYVRTVRTSFLSHISTRLKIEISTTFIVIPFKSVLNADLRLYFSLMFLSLICIIACIGGCC